VHGPTEIVDPFAFHWSDDHWHGLELPDAIIYELHVGTFTSEGTLQAAMAKIPYLRSLGITAIELMPVAAFPGRRNWGYDGVSPYSVHAAYGGPEALKRFVDAAHHHGIAVLLDVVYNHLGHEGNYLRLFGPYFTDRHQTPWGDAINFDGNGSEQVRRYFINNALYWIREYHLDGLRLDATHAIRDDSERHILQEIAQEAHALGRELGRKVLIIAETDQNDSKIVKPVKSGGWGLDALWSDDFHHAIHAALTGERGGYYQDFGKFKQIVRALNEGFVFQGEYFHFWKATRGSSPAGMSAPQHVICCQNHDQIGNRAQGERLSALISPTAIKAVAALLLLAPETPLLFMGEEYGETAPFQYFTSYDDRELAHATSEGRRREFSDFDWNEVPDPQDQATFDRSKLHWELANDGNDMLRWYRQLIRLRKRYVMRGERNCVAELLGKATILLRVPAEAPRLTLLARFSEEEVGHVPEGNCKFLLGAEERNCAVKIFAAPVAAL
jgi:maltooligosyltrehalose trehalohydrolase